jgi:hypothetical protein
MIRSQKKKLANTKTTTSPYWADESLGVNVMKVGSEHDVRAVVICSKFSIDRLRGFQSADP